MLDQDQKFPCARPPTKYEPPTATEEKSSFLREKTGGHSNGGSLLVKENVGAKTTLPGVQHPCVQEPENQPTAKSLRPRTRNLKQIPGSPARAKTVKKRRAVQVHFQWSFSSVAANAPDFL